MPSDCDFVCCQYSISQLRQPDQLPDACSRTQVLVSCGVQVEVTASQAEQRDLRRKLGAAQQRLELSFSQASSGGIESHNNSGPSVQRQQQQKELRPQQPQGDCFAHRCTSLSELKAYQAIKPIAKLLSVCHRRGSHCASIQ